MVSRRFDIGFAAADADDLLEAEEFIVVVVWVSLVRYCTAIAKGVS
jgi:hypothetical protein